MLLAAVVALLSAGLLPVCAEMPSDEEIAAAGENADSIAALLDGKTAEEAKAIAEKLMAAAVAAGGDENAVKNRIVRIVGICVALGGGNLDAIGAGLVIGAGESHAGLVVAALVVAGNRAGGDGDALGRNAGGSAPEAAKASVEEALADPLAYLGRIRVWMTEVGFDQAAALGEATSTTTSTTTTTLPTPTEVGLQ
jgi:hypothetical protein